MIDFRLTFRWSGSPGFWGVISAAAEHAHFNTTLDSTQLLDEGKQMTAHVKVVDRWEEGTPTPIPSDAKVRAHSGVRFPTQFPQPCTCVRVRISSDNGKTALITSASFASDHVCLFGPGEEGVSLIFTYTYVVVVTPCSRILLR